MIWKTVGLFAAVLVLGACSQQQHQTVMVGGIDLADVQRPLILPEAEAALKEKPETITAYPVHPANGSKTEAGPHDFYSEADYSWPNPANPTAPFISKDGQTTPTLFLDHRRAMWRLNRIVPTLTEAYLLTGDKKYADHALEHLRAWFITPDTRMNPSLNFAQAIPYRNVATQYGLIDTLHLVETARSIVALRQHNALSPEDDAALTQWFSDYVKWLRTSDLGTREGAGSNNHAAAYWLQIAAFAQAAKEPDQVEDARKHFKSQLIPQMAADGSFPRELARTKPYGYSLFQLDLMVMLAKVLSTPDDNLFTFKGPKGEPLEKALAFMYPYVVDKSKWIKPADVMAFDQWPVRSCAWLYGGVAYDKPEYLQLWLKLNPSPTNEEVIRNLPIRHWLLWENPR